MPYPPYFDAVAGLPRQNQAVSSRGRLLNALDAAAPAAMTILRGPRGTGKTTLLRDWASTQEHPVAWLSARRAPAVPDGLPDSAKHLATALLNVLSEGAPSAVVASFDQAAAAVAAGTPFSAALSGIRGFSTPRILILDDLHLAEEFEAEDLLLELLRAIPQLRILASTRTLGAIEQQRALLELDVAVIGPQELALTVPECAEALAGTRLAEQAQAVWETTGGSPRWVRFLSIKSSGLPVTHGNGALKMVLREAAKEIAELLRAPAVTPQTEDFLLATCVPVTLPEALACQLYPAGNVGELIHRAELDGFLTRTADGDATYVPLLRDALLQAVRNKNPKRLRALDASCAEYFLAAEQPLEALRHALGADNLDLATEVIRRHAVYLFTLHDQESRKLLEGVSLLRLVQQPAPAVALAILYSSSAFRRFKGLELGALALAAARTIFRSMPPAERLLLTLVEVVALRLTGQLSKAAGRARTGLQAYAEMPLSERERIGPLESVVVSHLGITLWRDGHHAEATDAFTQAATLAARDEQPDYEGYYHSLSACIRAANGDLPGAAHFLELSRGLGWGQTDVHPYAEVPLRLAEAMIALEGGDPAGARTALARITGQADVLELWPQIRSLEALTDLLDGRSVEALTRLEGMACRLQSLPAIGKAERQMLEQTQALLMLAAGLPGQALKLTGKLPKGSGAQARITARIQLACGQPQKALRSLGTLGTAETHRSRAETICLSIAARLQLDPEVTPEIKLQLTRLSALQTGYGLSLTASLLPAPDLERLRAAAEQTGLDVGLRGGTEAVIAAQPELLILTPREQAILQSLAKTGSLADIAELHFVSVNTVKSQLRSLYRKLGVTGRDDALSEAVRQGVL